ncbi:hypothetical protein D5086_028246 [Populus alba]|uniref:Uncharacterized protein n=1 Tax=Populus alba TaxID=43335 RepID=A0ACC4AYK9_POPAL
MCSEEIDNNHSYQNLQTPNTQDRTRQIQNTCASMHNVGGVYEEQASGNKYTPRVGVSHRVYVIGLGIEGADFLASYLLARTKDYDYCCL